MKNGRGCLSNSDQEKHLAWSEHYQRLLNEESESDKINLSVNEPSVELQPYIDKDSPKKALNRMKKAEEKLSASPKAMVI